MRISDWSSDVCSSDLFGGERFPLGGRHIRRIGDDQIVDFIDKAIEHVRLDDAHLVAEHMLFNVATRNRQRLRADVGQIDLRIFKRNRAGDADAAAAGAQIERSEEHTSELQSLMRISYAVFCLKKKNKKLIYNNKKHTQNG